MKLYHFILKLTSALLLECRNGGMYPEKYIFYEAGNLAFVYSAAEQGSASAHVAADAQSRRQDQGSELMQAPPWEGHSLYFQHSHSYLTQST